ncbi:hypothetical protein WJX84_002935 [Apatococcus fuscideae]|uniref:F-box domain-containing protein n=1 Tax=Apatococcus fuscideae TaxID=2026836 RepID=A0AAW1T0F3_9CHLO
MQRVAHKLTVDNALERLPADIWARIATYLNFWDILRMRLLQSLGLCTAASIVDDPKWQRLSALTCLHHESVGHMEGSSLAGSGIEAFPH